MFVLQEVATFAEQYACIRHIFLFGSLPRGDAREESDVDLLIHYRATSLSELAIDHESYGKFQEEFSVWAKQLEKKVGRRVSLHDAYFTDPPDAARPAVLEGARQPLAQIGKALAVYTPPKPTH